MDSISDVRQPGMTIPDGVRKYSKEWVKNSKGDKDFVEQFGVSRMYQTKVDSPLGKKSEEVNGVSIEYNPGRIVIKVNRTELTPQNIDRLGELCLAHETVRVQRDLLSKAIPLVEQALRELQRVPSPDRLFTGTSSSNEGADLIARQGAILEEMRAALPLRNAEYDAVVAELYSLAVVHLRIMGHGPIEEIPIARMMHASESERPIK